MFGAALVISPLSSAFCATPAASCAVLNTASWYVTSWSMYALSNAAPLGMAVRLSCQAFAVAALLYQPVLLVSP